MPTALKKWFVPSFIVLTIFAAYLTLGLKNSSPQGNISMLDDFLNFIVREMASRGRIWFILAAAFICGVFMRPTNIISGFFNNTLYTYTVIILSTFMIRNDLDGTSPVEVGAFIFAIIVPLTILSFLVAVATNIIMSCFPAISRRVSGGRYIPNILFLPLSAFSIYCATSGISLSVASVLWFLLLVLILWALFRFRQTTITDDERMHWIDMKWHLVGFAGTILALWSLQTLIVTFCIETNYPATPTTFNCGPRVYPFD